MIRNLLFKAARSADAASHLCDVHLFDDATSRAYYSMFDVARALLLNHDPESKAKTHGSILGEFSRIYVKTGLLPAHWGGDINRAQLARRVADYEGDQIDEARARGYVRQAAELFDLAKSMIPVTEHPAGRDMSPAEAIRAAREVEAVNRALVDAFSAAVAAKGFDCSLELREELVTYGDRDNLIELIAEIDQIQDLQSYIRGRVPVPSI